MKKLFVLSGLFTIVAMASTVSAQEKKKEIRKEVRMEEENGVKTLVITTTQNGLSTEEIYTGEEAERKEAELMGGANAAQEVKEEVDVKIINGEKTVTITTTNNGQVRKEVYTGAEADAKLKELEVQEPAKSSLDDHKIKSGKIEPRSK